MPKTPIDLSTNGWMTCCVVCQLDPVKTIELHISSLEEQQAELDLALQQDQWLQISQQVDDGASSDSE